LDPSSPASASSLRYDPDYFARLFAIEDRHFWFRARNHVIATVAGQIVSTLPPGYRVLEAGCGTGNVLRILQQSCARGVVVGMDPFAEGLRWARRRMTCPLVQGDVRCAPFRASFDLIGLFDVLEHLPDDEKVLGDLCGLLGPRGTLVLTVPDHPFLWSYFDEASHHVRRYRPAELERKLAGAGFEIEYFTPYMMSIFPLLWLKRRLSGFSRRPVGASDSRRIHEKAAGELRVTPILNGLLWFLLRQESRLITRRRRLPFGTSLLAIARKC
jgi:SAM-dependent methyltransferase